jgi:glycine/D-amino acid oxidase-like deaminating enzyme
LCIQQWAGQAFAAVPRDCSHSPIVFDLFCAAGYFLQSAATSLVVGADVIDATRWAFSERRLYPVRIF